MNIFSSTLVFLIQTIFDLSILLIMFRIIMDWTNVGFLNSFFLLIKKLTDFFVEPLRRLIPMRHGIDISSLLLLLLLETLKLAFLSLIAVGFIPNFSGIFIWGFADLISMLIDIYFFSIILAVICSFLPILYINPIIEVIYAISEPLLRLGRRYIPPIAGFDMSPILVLLVLKFIDIILVRSLLQIGLSLSLR